MFTFLNRQCDRFLAWLVVTLYVFARPVMSRLVPCVTSADTTTLSDLFKRVYAPMIEEQQNLEAVTYKEFGEQEGDELTVGGEGWFFETKMGGNQEGIGARAERGTLPSAGRQRYKQGKVLWKNCYGTFEITGQAIEASKSNLMAFAKARTEEMEGLTRDTLKDFNFQVFGAGNGVRALVVSETNTTTFVVDDATYLRVNMLIEVWDAAAPFTNNVGTISGGTFAQILSLTPRSDGNTDVTVDAAGAGRTVFAVGDFVVRAGERLASPTSVNNVMTGLQEIVDDGTISATFQNISRTTFPLWKGQVLDNAGVLRNVTLDLFQQAEDASSRAGSKRPDWVRMNYGQRRKFFTDLVAPDKRYMTGRMDGGWEKLEYNGNELTIDVDCPRKMIFFLQKQSIKRYTLRPFGLLDQDGLVIRQVQGQDLWRGHLAAYMNLGCKRCNVNVLLKDLQEPTEEPYIFG